MNHAIKIDWKFKRVVKEAGLTLAVLAELTGINSAYLCLYSNGRYNFTDVEKQRIAQAVGLPETQVFEKG